MLKRKLRANIENILSAKRKAKEGKLDVLFSDTASTSTSLTSASAKPTTRPTNVLECLAYIRGLVDWRKFCDKIPPVALQSQLYSLISDHSLIDSEISQLRTEGRIITIKLDSGTYGIVDKHEYLHIIQKQIGEEELDKDVGEDFVSFCTRDELDVEITSKQLMKHLKEGHVTDLVRAGYLTSEVTGMFYLTVPNASLFLRTLNEGLRSVCSMIKRSKFKEMQLRELLQREGRKTSKLGMTYYCLHIIGTEMVKLVGTTTGPLLRYIEDD